ncbi:MAG: hypothetical protein NKF70_00245 [Methanobacterium sp. ERen5]|nr:MAG: hypothetical protein NKF70_00245 [Methanobacterium sp. ERen5]
MKVEMSESEFKRYNDSQWEARKIALEDVDPELINILKGEASNGMCHIEKSNIKIFDLGNLGG